MLLMCKKYSTDQNQVKIVAKQLNHIIKLSFVMLFLKDTCNIKNNWMKCFIGKALRFQETLRKILLCQWMHNFGTSWSEVHCTYYNFITRLHSIHKNALRKDVWSHSLYHFSFNCSRIPSWQLIFNVFYKPSCPQWHIVNIFNIPTASFPLVKEHEHWRCQFQKCRNNAFYHLNLWRIHLSIN